MLKKTVKTITSGIIETTTFPCYFKHFKEELYSPLLYNEEEPIILIKINKKVVFIRKRRLSIKYKFYDNGKETTLNDIAKKIKTLLEFKEFLAGTHKRFTSADFMNDKPYKNVKDVFNRSRFVEYALYGPKIMQKKDRTNFDPENIFKMPDWKILRYFNIRRGLKLNNILSDSFLKSKGIFHYDFVTKYEGGRRFLYTKGVNFDQEVFDEFLKTEDEHKCPVFMKLCEAKVLNLIGRFYTSQLERIFNYPNCKDGVGLEPKHYFENESTSSVKFLDDYEFPFLLMLGDGEARVISKNTGALYMTLNYEKTIASGIVEVI
ncbi:MAG: hypothetical protein ACRCXX_13665 [Cetobacterium sp.]|uniref:hypothetical protein n=1 Tax=Cetobacterium sp. TaxID=2071632 RepID=UPI003F29FF1B